MYENEKLSDFKLYEALERQLRGFVVQSDNAGKFGKLV